MGAGQCSNKSIFICYPISYEVRNENIIILIVIVISYLMKQNSKCKRTKTDCSKSRYDSKSIIHQSYKLDSNTSKITNLRQQNKSFLSSIFQFIKHEVRYQKFTDAEIINQKTFLIQKINELNDGIHQLTTYHRESRKNKQLHSRKRVSTIAKQMSLDYQSLCHQSYKNQQNIIQLQQSYEYFERKLLDLSNPESKILCQRQITELTAKVRALKKQIGAHRKNKHIRQKEMIKTNQQQSHQMQDLQKQHLIYCKKRDQLLTKIQQIEQQKIDLEYTTQQLQDQYEQVKSIAKEYKIGLTETAQNSDHIKLIYKTRKRKLELELHKRERDQDDLKRKYLNYLLQVDQLYKKSSEIDLDSKIRQKEQEIYEKIELIQQLKQSLESIMRRKKNENSQNLDFMITQVRKTKKISDIHSESKVKATPLIRKNFRSSLQQQGCQQHKLNRQNAEDQIKVRKWQQNSIHNKSTHHESVIRNAGPAKNDIAKDIKIINRYKTEGYGTQQIEQNSFLANLSQNNEDQSYIQDFQV